MNTSSTTPIDIGNKRQLFVDDFWIADSSGVQRLLHEPQRREVALNPEHPWETGGLPTSPPSTTRARSAAGTEPTQ